VVAKPEGKLGRRATGGVHDAGSVVLVTNVGASDCLPDLAAATRRLFSNDWTDGDRKLVLGENLGDATTGTPLGRLGTAIVIGALITGGLTALGVARRLGDTTGFDACQNIWVPGTCDISELLNVKKCLK
jgi:hypothetical protein